MVEDPEPLIATVERVLHRSDDGAFAVILALMESGQRFKAAGRISGGYEPGDVLALLGEWEDHPKFGKGYKVRLAWPSLPASEEGVLRYLRSGRIPGIGQKMAERIVAQFGKETMTVLEENPARLKEVPGMGRKRLAQLMEAISDGRVQREAMIFLHGLGLGPALALKVWECHGSETQGVVHRNPYALASSIEGIAFVTADRIARSLGIEPDAAVRLRAGVRHALEKSSEQGHLCLPLGLCVERVAGLLSVAGTQVVETLERMTSDRSLRICQVVAPTSADAPEPLVYLAVLEKAESEVARLLGVLEEAPFSEVAPYRDSVRERQSIPLSEAQRSGLVTLSNAKVGILTGGPGVGKTTVLRELVRHFEQSSLEVALASPTGRAARRLEEATGRTAHTLHRLFGLQIGGRSVHQNKNLEADVLVVDEVSMLDLPLFVRVLKRMPPSARLILVGDPDQLPSVGPGSVLSDLIQSDRFPTVQLTEVFRQAEQSSIVRNAHRVRTGHMPQFDPPGSDGDCFFVERADGEQGAEMILKIALDRVPMRYGLDPVKDVQVLSPMHRGAAGVENLNARIQEAMHGDRDSLEYGSRKFHLGDRVMQIKNDYDRGVMNGDMGFVEELFPDRGALVVDLEGRDPLLIERKQLDELEPAFALTVHKSQGGEYPVVILSLFTEHHVMLRRHLLYTAMTRAQRVLVIVGNERAISRAVANQSVEVRYGALLERLQGHDLKDTENLRPFLDPNSASANG